MQRLSDSRDPAELPELLPRDLDLGVRGESADGEHHPADRQVVQGPHRHRHLVRQALEGVLRQGRRDPDEEEQPEGDEGLHDQDREREVEEGCSPKTKH